jgi:cytochrome c oxidase subunit 4
MSRPVVTVKGYALVWAVLILLTIGTTLIGYANLGAFNTVFAVGIATAMAALIAAFFMKAWFENRLVHIIIAGGVIWIIIMMSNTLGDYITRGWLPFPGK